MQHTVQTIGLTENDGICNTIRFFQMGFNDENKLELDNSRHNVPIPFGKKIRCDPFGSGSDRIRNRNTAYTVRQGVGKV